MLQIHNIFCNVEWVRCPPLTPSPSQFNTKDSGRRAESLTAMTTHALENDRFIFCADASRAAAQTCPGWHRRFSVGRESHAEPQTGALWQAFRLPGAPFCLLLQRETAATFKGRKKKRNRVVLRDSGKSRPRLPARLCGGDHMSRSFCGSFLAVLGAPAVAVMCVPAPCYYHRGGLCAPVRYIRAVRGSEWAQLVLAERAECALGNVEHLCSRARTTSSPLRRCTWENFPLIEKGKIQQDVS